MKPYARHNARGLVLQALYQVMFSGSTVEEVEVQFLAEQNLRKVDVEYFKLLLEGVSNGAADLDQIMTPYLDRPFEQLNAIELIVLRMAVFELKNCLDVPYRVVINEAVELAKKFGAAEGHKYVNGIVDKVARDLRQTEMK